MTITKSDIEKAKALQSTDKIILDAAIETIKQKTKLFVVHGIIGKYCTCGKLISECVDSSGKSQAGKHPITDAASPYPKTRAVSRKTGTEYEKPTWTLASTNNPNEIKIKVTLYN